MKAKAGNTTTTITVCEVTDGTLSSGAWISAEHFEKVEKLRCARIQELVYENVTMREAINTSIKALDGIKSELSASVYTVEDDEFETIYFVRGMLLAALAKIGRKEE
jgi:hypothetical protein